jgi:phosphoribosyl 1,2-cyclic phosphodiesterase
LHAVLIIAPAGRQIAMVAARSKGVHWPWHFDHAGLLPDVSLAIGITASRLRILEAADSLSREPITHLINTHWHFDHTDGNGWLNAEGAAILSHENTHKHLLTAQRVEDWTGHKPLHAIPLVSRHTFSSQKSGGQKTRSI